jgi:hypothetical protein
MNKNVTFRLLTSKKTQIVTLCVNKFLEEGDFKNQFQFLQNIYFSVAFIERERILIYL